PVFFQHRNRRSPGAARESGAVESRGVEKNPHPSCGNQRHYGVRGKEVIGDCPDLSTRRPMQDLPCSNWPDSIPVGMGTRILFVEDHVDTLDAMSRLLELSGFTVTRALSAKEALDA